MKTNTLFTLTFVVGLLVSSSIAAPISTKSRVSKRDEVPAGCPGTLRGPSGNAYYAFSSTLNNKVAQQACASCYNGVLADVSITDMQFLSENLEQTSSWIKSWNGDDYSGSCLTIQPNGGGVPSVGVDATCATESWPLCQAGFTQVDGTVKIDTSSATLASLAVPYTPSNTDDVTPADSEATTTSDAEIAEVELEVDASAPTKTEENVPADPKTTSTNGGDVAAVEVIGSETDEIPTKTNEEAAVDPEATCTSPGGNIVAEAEVEVLAPTKTEPEAAADPEATCTKPGHVADAEIEVIEATKAEPETAVDPEATYDTSDHFAAEADIEVVVPTKTEPETAADPEATYDTPGHNVAEAEVEEVVASKAEAEAPADLKSTTTDDTQVAEVVEVGLTPAQGTSPVPVATEEDPLLVRKEKVRAAFEEDKEACSVELAMGEQDPITNEYEIEHMSDHAYCVAPKVVV